MPDDSKKNNDKRNNDPKEQRKPRNSRNQASKVERKTERVEESKSVPKVTVPQKPPVYEDPGPEFYKSLKRETEEILKITEEENSKYKKKEIQSNWSKYEMPIESYEEIEDHDVGADYEKLIQAPLSIGGHFQFKHEKSWDSNTGPSLYDKYFEINMDNLSLAVSAIPFYERNDIQQSLFSETDMLSMNSRATKYKQKYFNDKSYTTAETDAHDRILNSLKESLRKNDNDSEKVETDSIDKEKDQENVSDIEENGSATKDDINLDFKSIRMSDNVPSNVHSSIEPEEKVNKKSTESNLSEKLVDNADFSEPNDEKTEIEKRVKEVVKIVNPPKERIETKVTTSIKQSETFKTSNVLPIPVTSSTSTETKLAVKPNDTQEKKNPVIESPEDLEKWLDDFLDG